MAAPMQNSSFSTEVMEMSDERLSLKIRNHYFNSSLTVLLPGNKPVPHGILESLAEQMSYKLKALPLYRFIEIPFIKAFVRQGNVYALSQNTSLLCHDCVALTPPGWLILHLTKDTYLELGLEAIKQSHLQKKNDIYVVKIDLLSDSFKPGRKGYDRVLWCLKDRLNFTFDFRISWVPKDVNLCSSSLAVYFSDLCNGVEKIEIEKSAKVLTSVPYPCISANQPGGSNTDCTSYEVFEWLGALACGIDVEKSDPESDTYVSSFFCPEPSSNCPRCRLFQVSGFLTPESISNIVQSLRKHASSQPDTNNFPTTLMVQGYRDSPMVWKTTIKEFHVPGDNLFCVLFLPEQKCWFMTAG